MTFVCYDAMRPRATTKTTEAHSLSGLKLALPVRGDPLTAREFVEQVAAANSSHKKSFVIAAISQAAGVSRGTMHNHCVYGRPVREVTAKRLRDWSDGWISAAKTLGVL